MKVLVDQTQVLDDPLTQFLLQVGPNIATQTGKGGTIGNILLASKEPVADLLKARDLKRKQDKQLV